MKAVTIVYLTGNALIVIGAGLIFGIGAFVLALGGVIVAHARLKA